MGSTGARQQAQVHFGQANARAVQRDAVIAGHGSFQATAQRGAVNGRHGKLAAGLDSTQHLVQGGAGNVLSKLGDIRAGDKSAPGAAQHSGLDRILPFQPLKGFDHAFAHCF